MVATLTVTCVVVLVEYLKSEEFTEWKNARREKREKERQEREEERKRREEEKVLLKERKEIERKTREATLLRQKLARLQRESGIQLEQLEVSLQGAPLAIEENASV